MTKQKNWNRTYSYWTYEKAGRTESIYHQKSDTTVLTSLDYNRDATGNVSKISRESGRTFYYTYDNLSQILSESIKAPDGTPIYAYEYEYDGARNRTHKVLNAENTYYEYNKANQLRHEYKGSENTYFFYDANGSTVRERQTDGFNRYYSYNEENMATEIKYAAAGDRTRLYYKYNTLFENTSETDWGAAGNDERNYSYDGINKVNVRDDGDSTIERLVTSDLAVSGSEY